MKDLDEELWKLGILAKTEHNEAAPAQHELAPIFNSSNEASDHNQLTMEIMKKVADKHNLVCLLHEKPFEGINGSGKHNNWSLCTDTGLNLFDPGKTPSENAQFLLFLVAVIKAIDEHQDLMRISVASAGNDHRLGGGEAPPAIASIYLGDELTSILEAIERGEEYNEAEEELMEIGVHVLPNFPKDTTDRNRTSPFAFTGNKFEFRMLGSSQSISEPNTVINTIVANELMQFADILEAAPNFNKALKKLIAKTIKEHKRIIFNGDGYSKAWEDEAKERGLLNLPSTVDALPHFIAAKNIDLFSKHNIYTESEISSRYEISLETYSKRIRIEALTLIDLVKTNIMPSITSYTNKLATTIATTKSVAPNLEMVAETSLLTKFSILNDRIYNEVLKLEETLLNEPSFVLENARFYHDDILESMSVLRTYIDDAEANMDSSFWTLPTYTDLVFSV